MIPATGNKLAAALDYITRGWAVFPLAPKCKFPFKGSKGFKDASKDAEIARSWWNEKPAANIGIATGEISGLFVVDLDHGAEGRASWAELCRAHTQPPIETLTAQTVSDGRHLLFKYPSGANLLSGVKVIPHIDTRGNGGYIVAAPSFVVDAKRGIKGPYTWINPAAPLAEMPAWLIAVCQTGAVSNIVKPPAQAQPLAPIQQGQRHNSVKRSIRGYAEDIKYSFILLWKRSVGLVCKSITPAPEAPFTVLELFKICLWAWNETKPHNQLSHATAWKMLEGASRKGSLAFGAPAACVHGLFIPTTQQLNYSNNSTSQ